MSTIRYAQNGLYFSSPRWMRGPSAFPQQRFTNGFMGAPRRQNTALPSKFYSSPNGADELKMGLPIGFNGGGTTPEWAAPTKSMYQVPDGWNNPPGIMSPSVMRDASLEEYEQYMNKRRQQGGFKFGRNFDGPTYDPSVPITMGGSGPTGMFGGMKSLGDMFRMRYTKDFQ